MLSKKAVLVLIFLLALPKLSLSYQGPSFSMIMCVSKAAYVGYDVYNNWNKKSWTDLGERPV